MPSTAPPFSNELRERYDRHLRLSGFGLSGQEALLSARVLLVGAGGLGCPAALYLAAAGVGTLGIIDEDQVALSNLQRQIAHNTETIGQPKTDSLASTLTKLNPHSQYPVHTERITPENAYDILSKYDWVLDGSDNYSTRFLLMDACFLTRTGLIQGAVHEFGAQLFAWSPHSPYTACYRCLFPEPPIMPVADCSEAGVLGVLPGVAGVLMATECIKHLCNLGTPLSGRLLTYDALDQDLKTFSIPQNPDCALCGTSPEIITLSANRYQNESTCPPSTTGSDSFDFSKFPPEACSYLDVREAWEYASAHLPGAINFPLSTMTANTWSVVRATLKNTVILYCQKGARSAQALEQIQIWEKAGSFSTPVKILSLPGGLDRYPL